MVWSLAGSAAVFNLQSYDVIVYNYITHFKQKILESDIGSDKSFFFR